MGSGKSTVNSQFIRENYHNVDIRQYEGTDQIGDMRGLDFCEGEFEEILCNDCIDHITFVEAKVMLRKMASWLKTNGVLRIHTPNLRNLARHLAMGDDYESLRWLYGSDGEGSTAYASNIIRWAYSKESLTKMVEAQGLTVIECVDDCEGFGFHLVAVKKC